MTFDRGIVHKSMARDLAKVSGGTSQEDHLNGQAFVTGSNMASILLAS